MSAFALGDNGGSTCNRAGVKSGACAAPGRMIRPDDFFVQTLAAPDVKSLAEGKVLNRNIDPLRTNYSNDASTNLLMQNIRAANKAKLEEILARRHAAPTPTQ
jgi:predicted phosphoribosyltransferase